MSCSQREGLHLNIVETMLSGTLAVTSDNRGRRELIHDGESTFLFGLNDDTSMADKVLNMLCSKKLQEQTGNKAISYSEDYALTNVKEELRSIYEWKKN